VTTDEIRQTFAREFPQPQVIPFEEGWEVRLEVDGLGVSTVLYSDITQDGLRICMGELFEFLGEEDDEDLGELH